MEKKATAGTKLQKVKQIASVVSAITILAGVVWLISEASAERFVDGRISGSEFAKKVAQHESQLKASRERDIRVEEQLKAIKDDSDEIKEAIKVIERYMIQGPRN